MRNLWKKNRCWNLNSRRSRAGHAAGRSPIIRNGNISRITAGSVRRSTEQALLQEPASGAGRRLRFRNLFSTGQITVRSAGRGSGRLRRLQEHAKGVGAGSHFRLPLSTGLTFAGNVRQGEIRDMDQNNHGFPTEWDLEEKKAEEQHLDNRDAWALKEERHYQWLEDEYNGVKHRLPRKRKKKAASKK